MKNKFDAGFFLKKWMSIPEKRWKVGDLGQKDDDIGAHCALGHSGVYYNSKSRNAYHVDEENKEEVEALKSIYFNIYKYRGKKLGWGGMSNKPAYNQVFSINDGSGIEYGETPKKRMICSLIEYLKENGKEI